MEKIVTKELTEKQIQDILSGFVEAKEKQGSGDSRKIFSYVEYSIGAVQLPAPVLKTLREARTKKARFI